MRGLFTLIAIAALSLAQTLACAAERDAVLVIGGADNVFADALKRCGVKVVSASAEQATHLDLGGYGAVVAVAMDHRKPTALTDALQRDLEAYVRSGGRALVEFTKPESGRLFGIELGVEPILARHERIVVSKKLPEVSALRVGTLLDEQYSYVLPVKGLPPRAERVLDYGEFVGTYELKPSPSRFHEFWVDLGKPIAITAVSQRYGGLNPYYCPDSVELLAGLDERQMRSLGKREGDWLSSQTASFTFGPVRARYVLLRCIRGDTGPGSYWFFAGEITVTAEDGSNVALHKPAKVVTPVFEETWRKSQLTDGIIDGGYTDGKSLQLAAVGEDFGVPKWPALVRAPFGRGMALVLTSKISDWPRRHFRPTQKWAELTRGIVLDLLPPRLRAQAVRRYVPLRAYTEPRRWLPTGSDAELVVDTAHGAKVSAECAGLKIGRFTSAAPGKWSAKLKPQAGDYVINVEAKTAHGSARSQVRLLVADRKTAYSKAVQKSMRWFLESGIMPSRDGAKGVRSTIFVPSPDEGPQEDLEGAYRTDCEAMCADAFVRFAQVSGDQLWLDRAKRLGDRLVACQRKDLTKADYGSFPWILGEGGVVKNGHIWFHDNESRCACALLDLYAATGDVKYLQAGLRSMQLALDVSREDFTIAMHSVAPEVLDKLGRAAFRELSNYPLRHFDMLRWFTTYSVTGDEVYLNAARTVARLYYTGSSPFTGSHIWAIGPYACALLSDKSVRAEIDKHAAEMLKDPDIARFGTVLSRGPGDYRLLYRNDSSINTGSEPLSDQLYTTPMSLRRAWLAYKSSGSRAALKVFTNLADFLVRIQLEDPSPKVDGCWVRGFDVDLWEDFGAPYDPNYGPYHAYSGWMNSMISEGLAWYVLDADPLALRRDLWASSKPFVEETRRQRPPDKTELTNIARGKSYTVTPATSSGRPDVLTDGIIDGHLDDGQSLVWEIPKIGQAIAPQVTIDLGQSATVAMVGARMGALNPNYNADEVTIEVGEGLDSLRQVACVQAGPDVNWSVWKAFEPAKGRCVRLTYRKTCFTKSQDKLVIGEITILRASGR